jgi:hypothetical protein
MSSQISTRLSVIFVALAASIFLGASEAEAGFMEIGGSGSYKKSNIGTDSFDESQSLTASFSYYFDESSALELSYTDGLSRRVIGQSQPDGQLTNMYYKMIGLDLVLTLGEREATLRPYVKIGGVYIMDKRFVTQYWSGGNVFPESTRQDPAALVPSAGVGFKLSLTKSWSLKVGVEAWSSRSVSEQPVTVDYSGRVGLSCMF